METRFSFSRSFPYFWIKSNKKRFRYLKKKTLLMWGSCQSDQLRSSFFDFQVYESQVEQSGFQCGRSIISSCRILCLSSCPSLFAMTTTIFFIIIMENWRGNPKEKMASSYLEFIQAHTDIFIWLFLLKWSRKKKWITAFCACLSN